MLLPPDEGVKTVLLAQTSTHHRSLLLLNACSAAIRPYPLSSYQTARSPDAHPLTPKPES